MQDKHIFICSCLEKDRSASSKKEYVSPNQDWTSKGWERCNLRVKEWVEVADFETAGAQKALTSKRALVLPRAPSRLLAMVVAVAKGEIAHDCSSHLRIPLPAVVAQISKLHTKSGVGADRGSRGERDLAEN